MGGVNRLFHAVADTEIERNLQNFQGGLMPQLCEQRRNIGFLVMWVGKDGMQAGAMNVAREAAGEDHQLRVENCL